jgi:hypothetical protein
MPTTLLFVLGGVIAAALIAWAVTSDVRKTRARKATLARLGFVPCPDRQRWLEETVTRMAYDPEDRYEVREPRRLRGDAHVYYYVKHRVGGSDSPALAEEEVLFPLERRSAAAVRLIVKPSSLGTGLATRILSSIATLPGGAEPDRFQRLELPRDRGETNLIAALGPRGVSLYDLIDSSTLGMLEGLGDAGAIFVQLQDGWCAVASPTSQIPFRADEVVSRIRPLLRA